MARPTIRTATLDVGELEVLRGTLGTCTNAYRLLKVSETVTWWTFQRLWRGLAVQPEVVRVVREGWNSYAMRVTQMLRESQKPPVEEMFTPGGSPKIMDAPAA